jgi:hypothetical protein
MKARDDIINTINSYNIIDNNTIDSYDLTDGDTIDGIDDRIDGRNNMIRTVSM